MTPEIQFGHGTSKPLRKLDDHLSAFLHEVRKHHVTEKLADVLYNTVHPQNLLGTGTHSNCYAIPEVKGYVLRVAKSSAIVRSLFERPPIPTEASRVLEGRNYGQAIMDIGDNKIQVLLEQSGIPHSMIPWTSFLRRITPLRASSFLAELETISKFEQEAYDRLADEISFLNTRRRKMDSLNPNNLLIDYDQRTFGLIDLHDKSDLQSGDIDAFTNTFQDMACILIDALNFKKFFRALDDTEKQRLIQASKAIIEKCKIAAQKQDLPSDDKVYEDYLAAITTQLPKAPPNLLIKYYHFVRFLMPEIGSSSI